MTRRAVAQFLTLAILCLLFPYSVGNGDPLADGAAIRHSCIVKENDEGARLTLPAGCSRSFDILPDAIKDPLTSFVQKEFSRPGKTTPSDVVNGLMEVLSTAGFSDDEIQNVLAAWISRGLFSFENRGAAVSTLLRLFPENDHFQRWMDDDRQHVSGRVPGSLHICWQSGARDPYNADALQEIREERNDSRWQPASISELAVRLYFLYCESRSGADSRAKPGGPLSLTAYVTAWTTDRETKVWERQIAGNFLCRSGATYQRVEFPIVGLEYLTGETLDVEVKYKIDGSLGDGSKPVNHEDSVWVRLLPVPVDDKPDAVLGYRVIALGPSREILEVPELVEDWITDAMETYLMRTKETLQDVAREAKEVEKRKNGLVGQVIDTLPLASAKDARHDLLQIPSNGEVLLFFGATWCGPCAVIEPQVSAFVDAQRARRKVYRLSIDQEPEKFLEALSGRYPDGVITTEGSRKLVIDSIPRYVYVRDGRIVETGDLTPDTIKELSRRFLDK